ncbi:MAG: 2-isopropylmalate synthase [Bryobacterales bacterium]|nr:2-isopropylmalate synthase [Bryobacterales bacterium]
MSADPGGETGLPDNFGARAATHTMNPHVFIFDTTLRDGEQSPGCSMTVPEKVRMARKLVELGADIIEAGFPIASEGDYESVLAVSREFPEARVAALARAVPKDIERAARALEPAKKPRIHTFIATSDIHLKYKLRKTREQVLEDAVAAVKQAREFTDDVEFSAEDATRTEPDFLEQISLAVVDAGATTVNLPDTVGYTIPREYAGIIGRIVRALDNRAIVSVHCHNDLGLAVANSLAAIEVGARQVECTINGIGERAGNAALEEIVMILKVRSEIMPYRTSIREEHLYPASQLLTEFITFGPQPNKAIVGSNAFAHEAGIHQDGYLKEPTTYEIMNPRSVGVPDSKLVLGKHSGRHALADRAKSFGYTLTGEQLDAVYEKFISVADNKKGFTNDEIRRLVEEQLRQPESVAN